MPTLFGLMRLNIYPLYFIDQPQRHEHPERERRIDMVKYVPRKRKTTPNQTGFTLIELVMVIVILGILSVVALPKFVDLGTSARVAAVNSLMGTIHTAANNFRAACAVDTNDCNLSTQMGSLTYQGKTYGFNYGWIGAGTGINTGLIDSVITYTGFTASIANPNTTFSLNSVKTPATCSVTYGNAWSTASPHDYTCSVNTSGC